MRSTICSTMLAACLAPALAGAAPAVDLTDANAGKWSTVAHPHASAGFDLPQPRIDASTKKVGAASLACDVAVGGDAGGEAPLGYFELRYSANELMDLSDVRALRFSYRFSKPLRDGAVHNCWVNVVESWSKDGGQARQSEGIEYVADGKWHDVLVPLHGMTPTPHAWPLDKARYLTICFYLNPAPGEKLAFTFNLDGVEWVAKAPLEERPPALLFQMQPDAKVEKQLLAAGYVVHNGDRRDRIELHRWLTRALLRQFNAFVMTDFPQTGTKGATPEQKQIIDTLRWYVEQGGGLFVWGGNDQDTGMCVRFQNELLAAYGVRVLRECVTDDKHRIKGRHFNYLWTDDVAEDPLTQDVAGLYYPLVTGWGGTSWTNPLQVDGTWRVLVRGMPTTYTLPLFESKHNVAASKQPATYKSSPPLVAVKQAGAGRISLWPTRATCSFVDGYHFMWDDGLVLEGSADGRRSDGLKLVTNLLAHLVEPTAKSGRFGGFRPAGPRQIRSLANEPGFRRFDWSSRQVAAGCRNAYKFLIGARTALSSGQGTVAEYAAAARKHGYDAIVFSEDLEKMSSEKWDRLKAECREHTTEDFLAVEGLKWTDQVGNQGVVFGDIGWVKDGWMSAEHPGRIKVLWHFTHGYDIWPPSAVIHPKLNPKKPWHLGKCKGFTAYTYRNGDLIDDSQDLYLKMTRLNFDDFVLAVHLLDAPEHVAAAAKDGNMQAYVRADSLQQALRFVHGSTPAKSGWHWTTFVSNGPEVQQLQAVNFGTTDLAVEGAERVRLRVTARSEAPLREVKLMDGDDLFRRFRGNGSTFDLTFDYFHDRQRYVIAVVTDARGRTATSWCRWTNVQEQWLSNCHDNWNYMEGGKWRGSRHHTLRGSETYYHTAPIVWVYPQVQALRDGKRANLTPPRPAVFVETQMVSRFCSVVDFSIEGAFPPTASANWNNYAKPEPISPAEDIACRTRRIRFTSRPDHPRVELFEVKLKYLKPETPDPSYAILATYTASNNLEGYRMVTYTDAKTGQTITERRPEALSRPITHAGEIPAGGYAAIWPYHTGGAGIVALDPGLRYRVVHIPPNSTRCELIVDPGAKELPAGHEVSYRFLAVWGPRFESVQSNHFMEWVKAGFGLQGEPLYRVEPVLGRVAGTRYVLDAVAEDGGFRARFGKAALPSDLPVRVAGLNDRWQAGVWYVGKVRFKRPEWTFNIYGGMIAVLKDRTFEDAFLPGPVEAGVGWFALDVEDSDREVYVGHPVVCDRDEAFLQLLDWRAGSAAIEVHNPTDAAVDCTVRNAKGFTLLGEFSRRVAVPAGESVTVQLAPR